MSTKQNPGKHDCYSKAEPDEPYFMILARDVTAPEDIRHWILQQQMLDRLGIKKMDPDQIAEAYACIPEMERWYRDYQSRKAMAALEFDHLGHPTTGEHARKDRTSTSGAND